MFICFFFILFIYFFSERPPAMIGPIGVLWQPALLLVVIAYTLYAVIWANKNACLLALVSKKQNTKIEITDVAFQNGK